MCFGNSQSLVYPVALVAILILSLLGCTAQQAQDIVAFPKHDEPLPTDWGFKGHIMARLAVEDGCLRAVGAPSPNDPDSPPPSYLLIWPKGYTLAQEGDSVQVRSWNGIIVARVDDAVRFSGRLVGRESDLARSFANSVAKGCPGPYYLVGDDVTIIGPDEPEVVVLPGYPLHFQRRKTSMHRSGTAYPLVGFGSAPSKLLLEGDCLIVRDRVDRSKRYMPMWRPGFHPHIGSDGVVEIRNGGGRTIARVGDRLLMTGRGSPPEPVVQRCNAISFRVWEIRNVDFPLVIPRHDEARDTGRRVTPDYIKGEPRLHNGCLNISRRVLVWPSDFTIRGEAGSIEIINEKGRVLSREGEHTILKGRSVDLDDDMGRLLSRTVPIDCQADSFWVVLE